MPHLSCLQQHLCVRNHYRNLSGGIEWTSQEGITQRDSVQYFDAGDRIRETIVGIVAGKTLGADGVSYGKTSFAFASKNEDEVKISARATGIPVGEDPDRSVVMCEASQSAGGDGGHDVTAGATIPSGEESAFLYAAKTVVSKQVG